MTRSAAAPTPAPIPALAPVDSPPLGNGGGDVDAVFELLAVTELVVAVKLVEVRVETRVETMTEPVDVPPNSDICPFFFQHPKSPSL
jgi:hypothetical protein